ncbi:MAG: cyanophycin synthetase [Patescibacteria group bacterium]|nr:cyanophycin synthetase [Patescibacteria group bacterium]
MSKIFLVGIGGISMSGIAKYELKQGNQVYGSDIKENEEIKELRKMGATIYLSQKAENIEKNLPIDLLVYSSAITIGSPGDAEIEVAKKQGVKILKRSEYLGSLTREFSTIAIAGMHGKTTVTAMLGYVLKEMGEEPLVFVGAETGIFDYSNVEIPSNKPKIMVIEACEYDGSFLDFSYDIGVILNIEPEHLDYFTEGLPQILKTFNTFSKINAQSGTIVALDHPTVRQALDGVDKKLVYFDPGELEKEKIELKIPGAHNRLNALAVLKVIEKLGLSVPRAKEILKNFPGTKRRLEYRGEFKGVPLYDDYAHHPTEIKASIEAIHEKYPNNNLFLIFQPHQYSRTTLLFDDFINSLSLVDKLCLVEVFGVAGREEMANCKNSNSLFEALKDQVSGLFYAKDYDQAENIIRKKINVNDILVVMGAGPINILATKLIKNYE